MNNEIKSVSLPKINKMEYPVDLVADAGLFKGLGRQNMLFHQCIGELIDNSIAAKLPSKKFRIDIILHQEDGNDLARVYIIDNGKGMSLETFKASLQPGKSATTDSRLNEHGFGLKNALATLSSNRNHWKIWTKDFESNKIYSVSSPFTQKMNIKDEKSFPKESFFPDNLSTIIEVDVKFSMIQTVQGRGAKAQNLHKLRIWLVEHLGVFYRGYLENKNSYEENDGEIFVSIDSDVMRVNPVHVPFSKFATHNFKITLEGVEYTIEYQSGILDREKQSKLVKNEPSKYYYQGNQPTQGIDIRLGKRVIATHQLETIWTLSDGKPIIRHNNYNDFVGELIIPDLPRGVLTTVNNKTDFNLDDPEWHSIFEELRKKTPTIDSRSTNEKELTNKWIKKLRDVNPVEKIAHGFGVWNTSVKIDVYRKKETGDVIIYEMKIGDAAPLDLYQLKMYWDGMVLQGEEPTEAILMCKNYSDNIKLMCDTMNTKFTPPQGYLKPYNFKLEKYPEKGLE